MSNDIKAVEFVAEVRPVKQMADGTVNITYNVPEYCAEQAKQHIDWHGLMVKIVAQLEE